MSRLDVPFPVLFFLSLSLFPFFPPFTPHRLARPAPFILRSGIPVSALEAVIGSPIAIALLQRTGGVHPFRILRSIGIGEMHATQIVIGFATVIVDPLLLPGDVW